MHDFTIVEAIIAAIPNLKSQHILEIGPGRGALTSLLHQRCAHLQCIEIDRDLSAKLKTQFTLTPNVVIINEDILSYDFSSLQVGTIVGNLPYNIASQIIVRLILENHSASSLLFMVQAEVAHRLVARVGDKHWGRLAMLCSCNWELQSLFDVEPESFTPTPKVLSTVVLFQRKKTQRNLATLKKVQQLARQAFGQRRKTLANNLKSIYSAQQLEDIGIDPQSRAEQLSLDKLLQLMKLNQN